MVKVEINGNQYNVETSENHNRINDKNQNIDVTELNDGHFHIIINDRSYSPKVLSIDNEKGIINVVINDRVIACKIKDNRQEIKDAIAVITKKEKFTTTLTSPMPGLIEKILVRQGDEIEENTPLIILNAMKMENTLKATKSGKVEKVYVSEGDQVEKGKELLQF